MFRLLTNNLKIGAQSFKKANSKKILNFNFSVKNTGGTTTVGNLASVSERLSFLKSEEQMRKYFNIVDWEKKACEEEIQAEFNREKEEYSRIRRDYSNFDRKELFRLVQDFKAKLKRTEGENLSNGKLSQSTAGLQEEIRNEFYLDNIEFLKDKPDNYLLVSGFENVDDIKTILNLF